MNKISISKIVRTGLSCSLVITMVACGGGADTVENETVEGTTAMEDNAVEMDTWDNNRFNESFTSTGRFGGWDENGDNMLDENEYHNSNYDTWDINNDDAIDSDEWNNASRDFGMQNMNMTEWDANKDNRIDQNEFRTGAAKNNNFGTFDKNGDKKLDEREYSDGVFGTWDGDRDGSITNDEYNTRYNRYYGNNNRQ